MSFIDHFSRKIWTVILKSKDEAFDKFKAWIKMIELQTGRKLKRLRTDNGLEYCSKEFEGFCEREGIVRHKTVPRIPQQNGLAERFNRTLLERVRCMMIGAGVPKIFWAEAVTTAAYLINRCPSTALDLKTPEEVWTGKRLDLGNLRVFGCVAYAHIRRDKLESHAVKCMFIGYSEGVKGFKLWSLEPGMKRCILSRDVIFSEGVMAHLDKENGSLNFDNCGNLRHSQGIQIEVEPREVTADVMEPHEPAPEPEQEPEEDHLEQDDQSGITSNLDHADDLLDYSLCRDRPRLLHALDMQMS